MAPGKHTLAAKFAHLTRVDLEKIAEDANEEVSRMGALTRRLDLLTCRELASCMSFTSGLGTEAGELLIQKAQVFDDALWGARAAGVKRKSCFLLKAAEFCTSMEEVQRLYEVWPKNGQDKEVLMKKACELASSKDELASFVIQNKLI